MTLQRVLPVRVWLRSGRARRNGTHERVNPLAPQLRKRIHRVAVSCRHVELEELAFAAGVLERREVLAAVTDRIERIVPAIEPDRRPTKLATTSRQGTIDFACGAAARADPAADKIDDAQHILRMLARIGYRQ